MPGARRRRRTLPGRRGAYGVEQIPAIDESRTPDRRRRMLPKSMTAWMPAVAHEQVARGRCRRGTTPVAIPAQALATPASHAVRDGRATSSEASALRRSARLSFGRRTAVWSSAVPVRRAAPPSVSMRGRHWISSASVAPRRRRGRRTSASERVVALDPRVDRTTATGSPAPARPSRAVSASASGKLRRRAPGSHLLLVVEPRHCALDSRQPHRPSTSPRRNIALSVPDGRRRCSGRSAHCGCCARRRPRTNASSMSSSSSCIRTCVIAARTDRTSTSSTPSPLVSPWRRCRSALHSAARDRR